jgi:ribosomal protein L11 methyltransferase
VEKAFRYAGLPACRFNVIPLAERDWVGESLAGLAPVTIGCLTIHGSHDRNGLVHAGLPIEIDAGLAFGTGHHGSTIGCLLAMQQVLKRRKPANCLDIGCGSGILAIAAAKLARIPVLATDIDPDAVETAKINCRLNGVSNLVRCVTAADTHHPEIAASAPYSLIVANILARPLVKLAPAITSLLAHDGRIILSGLTTSQTAMVRVAYQARNHHVLNRLQVGDWTTLILGRKKKGMA